MLAFTNRQIPEKEESVQECILNPFKTRAIWRERVFEVKVDATNSSSRTQYMTQFSISELELESFFKSVQKVFTELKSYEYLTQNSTCCLYIICYSNLEGILNVIPKRFNHYNGWFATRTFDLLNISSAPWPQHQELVSKDQSLQSYTIFHDAVE